MKLWLSKWGGGSGEGWRRRFVNYLSECEIPKKIYTLGTSKTENRYRHFRAEASNISGKGPRPILSAGLWAALVNITISILNFLNYRVIFILCT